MISGALRRDPEAVAAWAAELPRAASVVVYCAHGHELSQGAARALAERGIVAQYLEGGIEEGWKARGGALDRKPPGAATRWVTRERPKIDRIACPWLLRHFRLTDPALARLAVIVRGADTARLAAAPQAAGLHAISLGLGRIFADEHEMLRHGMVLYAALYAWCKEGQDELRTWNPGAYR